MRTLDLYPLRRITVSNVVASLKQLLWTTTFYTNPWFPLEYQGTRFLRSSW